MGEKRKPFLYYYLRVVYRILSTVAGILNPVKRSSFVAVGQLLGVPRYDPLPQFIPPAETAEITSDETVIELHGLAEQDGSISLFETAIISRICRERCADESCLIFEIGTFTGRTTLNMAVNAPGAHIYTLDLAPEEIGKTVYKLEENEKKYVRKLKAGAMFHGTSVEERITQLYGDSAACDFSDWYGMADLVFVDGSHAYDYVINDARLAARMIKPGGIIVFHDYGTVWRGVTAALNWLYENDSSFSTLRHIQGTSLVIRM